MNHDKLTTAACKLRELIIERNIANLETMIARTKMIDLDNKARDLEHQVMKANGDLNSVVNEGIPNSWDVQVDGDNEQAKELLNQLYGMKMDLRMPEDYDPDREAITPMNISIDGVPEVAVDLGRVERILAKAFTLGKEKQINELLGVAVHRELDTLPNLIPNPDMKVWSSDDEPDMTPWDSLTE